MEAAQSTFISSTFWTERIGPSAALKTLEVMHEVTAWEYISAMGLNIKDRWRQLSKEYGLPIVQWGIPALCGFSFEGENTLAYKTLITQEMLKKGYLAANSVYVSIEHTKDVVDAYFDALVPIFKLISECEEGRDVNELLDGPVCHGGFQRLN
jgi:glutamate-1-semialdehyde 2,1-aminomutase